jgi:hypothetical protein
MGEPPRSVDVATEPQQEATVAMAVATTTTAVPTVPSTPALAGGGRADAVEIPNDDAPPPGWGQWGTGPRQPPSPRRGC